jgi:hypothetical protein
MEHRMILISADFREIRKVVIARKKAPLVEPVQHDTRNVEAPVRIWDGAPQEDSEATD